MTETNQATNVTHAKPERRLPAFAVSRGIGIGPISFFQREKQVLLRVGLNAGQIEAELERFRLALDTSINQLRELSSNNGIEPEKAVSGIFGVHLLILESSIVENIETVISTQLVNSEWAIRTVLDEYRQKQNTVADPQFSDKCLDIEDVTNRLLAALGCSHAAPQVNPNAVIVIRDPTPSMIMEFAKSRPAGLIAARGGWTSHSSILAREFNLPMVTGVRDLDQIALLNDQVIVDGINGEVILNPSVTTLAELNELVSPNEISSARNNRTDKDTSTRDGTRIIIRANVDQPEAYSAARDNGAKGIGLFRSESLLHQPGELPGEGEQMSAYRRIADAVGADGVNIRTFDVNIDQLYGDSRGLERNPSLGLRSIRLSLAEPAKFRIQLRALLRASFDRSINIIIPMVSGLSEILRTQEILEAERADLTKASISFGTPKIGAMIETPSAVLTLSQIVKNVDFLCLGTNDLVQYLLAVDRDNEAVADWYQTLHPAVLKAVSEVLAAAQNAGIPIAVCGEMAGSPFYVPVLIGLGARELSMNGNSIQTVRQLLSGITISETVALVERVRSLGTADEIEDCLREYYLKNWSGLFPPGLLSVRHR